MRPDRRAGAHAPRPVDFHWLELDATRATALVLALALGAADAVLARPASTRRLNLAEGAALLIFFGSLPALASVGLYFSFWHGWRHLRRLVASENLRWASLVRQAVPTTLGAVAMLGGLAIIASATKGCFSPIIFRFSLSVSSSVVLIHARQKPSNMTAIAARRRWISPSRNV